MQVEFYNQLYHFLIIIIGLLNISLRFEILKRYVIFQIRRNNFVDVLLITIK